MSNESKIFLTRKLRNVIIKVCQKRQKIKKEVNKMNKVKINKVKAFREALNKSQSEMAILLNISQGTYCKKERRRKFSDKEKIILTNYFKENFPNESLESIFF